MEILKIALLASALSLLSLSIMLLILKTKKLQVAKPEPLKKKKIVVKTKVQLHDSFEYYVIAYVEVSEVLAKLVSHSKKGMEERLKNAVTYVGACYKPEIMTEFKNLSVHAGENWTTLEQLHIEFTPETLAQKIALREAERARRKVQNLGNRDDKKRCQCYIPRNSCKVCQLRKNVYSS